MTPQPIGVILIENQSCDALFEKITDFYMEIDVFLGGYDIEPHLLILS